MPAIEREEENQTNQINWFITVSNTPTDAYQVQFRIFDISAGLPGIQVFPAVPGAYEDVTNAPGKFATGSYYAYDNALGAGWTPSPTESVGSHRIEWRWKATASHPFKGGYEDFEVLPVGASSGDGFYCTIDDIRGLGLDVDVASDVSVQATIELCSELLDRACRQWFNQRPLTIRFDGTDSDTLHLGVPIISVEYLKVNDNPAALEASNYVVYSARSYPDDRRNPRIKLRSMGDYADIYTAPIIAHDFKFRKGRQNQELKGVFGFVEEDGSTPKLIKRACMKLVVEKLTRPIYTSPSSPLPPPPPIVAGAVVEEETDGHMLRYSELGTKDRRPSPYAGLTTDPEVLDIIKMYRAPIGIATPAHPSHTG